jgi:hypothetical protein
MRRRAGHFVAGITSLFVALCTTCGVAPGFVLSQAIPFAASSSAPMCSRTGDCGSSCPTEGSSRPTECRTSPDACGFLVRARAGQPAPEGSSSTSSFPVAVVALSARGAALRSSALAASPPLNVLHRSFRN